MASDSIQQSKNNQNKKPRNLWKTCSIIVIISTCLGIILFAGGLWKTYDLFLIEPEGLSVEVEMDTYAEFGQEIQTDIILENNGDKSISINEIQFHKQLLKFFKVIASTPQSVGQPEDYPDFIGYKYDLSLEPANSQTVTINLEPLKKGHYTGDLDVLVGWRRASNAVEGIITGELILQDDFSDPGSGWIDASDEDSSLGYQNGEYWINIITENIITRDTIDPGASNVIVSVDTRVETPSGDGFYGIICREQEGKVSRFYSLVISEDGYYNIEKTDGQEITSLLEGWTYSEIILQKQPVKITAGCVGDRFWLAVDGILLAEVFDTDERSIQTGKVGMVVGNFEGGSGFNVAFDNFTVYNH